MSYPHVVRVFATQQSPDHESPWQKATPQLVTGSGVIVAPGRILTGAHVVACATFIRVRQADDPTRHQARVVAVSHDRDLALLEVTDPAALAGIPPAPLGDLPAPRDKVSVVGYPMGGEELSITEGVVSRIELQDYAHSGCRLLTATIDAAINSGNSGGPVFAGDYVVGIAIQKMSRGESIGHMVPATIVRRFLDGVAHGRSPVVPSVGVTVQPLENPALRASLSLGPDEGGVLVTTVDHGGSAQGILRPGDVILEVDGLAVAANGTVLYLGRHRTEMAVVMGDHDVGDALRLRVLRDGSRAELEVVLKPPSKLVGPNGHDAPPRFMVVGGLVFQALTRDYLDTWFDINAAPSWLLHALENGRRTADVRELVVLTQILGDEINAGYESLRFQIVAQVSDHTPRDLDDFAARIDGAVGRVRITTQDQATIVLDTAALAEADQRIALRYGVGRIRRLGA